MGLDLESGLSQIEYIIEKETEELLYQRWIHDLQFQMSFDEFKAKLIPKESKTEQEILTEVEDILRMEWR